MLRPFQSAKLRYFLVGIVAFMLGSATIGGAAATVPAVGSLFYTTLLNGQATTPCRTVTTTSGQTTTCTAVVDADGNLHVATQGPASVNVTNTPTVKLDPTSPITIASAHDLQAVYASSAGCGLAPAQEGMCDALLLQRVAPGQRLVFETVTMFVRIPTGTPVLELVISGGGGDLFFSPTRVGSDGTFDTYAVTAQIRAYITNTADAPASPFCRVLTGALSAIGFFECTVEGYLVTPS